jgi:nucleoside-diphosphate-sugar epimerase
VSILFQQASVQKILITGSTGLLGSHVLRKLLEDNEYTPVAMVRSISQKKACEKIGIEAVIGDLLDPETLKTISSLNFSGLIHCAAIAGDWVNKELAEKINVLGTENLTNAFSGIKTFIHISTIGVYGHKSYHNISEKRKYRKSSIYENSKIRAEKIIKKAVKEHPQTKYVIIRPPTMYGENDRHFFPRLLKYIRSGKFKFVGRGKVYFPLIHADDAANAIVSALSTGVPSGTAFHISGPTITLRDFINELSQEMKITPKIKTYPYYPMLIISLFYEAYGKIFNKEPYIFRKRIRYMGRTRNVNISKSVNELGFKPKIALKDGIRRTLIFFMEEENRKNVNTKLNPFEQYLKDIPYFFIYILEKISSRFSSEKSLLNHDQNIDKRAQQ